jgi:hypothetical protein
VKKRIGGSATMLSIRANSHRDLLGGIIKLRDKSGERRHSVLPAGGVVMNVGPGEDDDLPGIRQVVEPGEHVARPHIEPAGDQVDSDLRAGFTDAFK